MRSHLGTIATITASLVRAAATADANDSFSLQKRDEDSFMIFNRKRNAHACMMSIVFIVLFPLGAISLHLPLKGYRVIPFVHAPIQVLGLAMLIGAMGLGIDIAKNDLFYFSGTVPAHVAIGLLTCSMIILLQPAMGLLQHQYYKRHGERSIFSHIHRWNGRIFIILGWVNSGLGLHLARQMGLIGSHSFVRNFVLMGVLGGLWFMLVGVDSLRKYYLKRDKLSAYSAGLDKIPLHRRRAKKDEELRQPSI